MYKVLNKRTATVAELRDAVYVGRPSKYGNPFVIGRDGNRDEVITKYAIWLRSKPELMADVKRELRGKDLVCWCAPQICHADILMVVADAE